MKVINLDNPNAPSKLFEDFVRLLHNGYSESQLRLACLRFGQLKQFGFIIPRKFLVNITCPYELAELDWTNWQDQDKEIYSAHDAVMIKSKSLQ